MRIRQAKKILSRWSDEGYRYADHLDSCSRLVAIQTYHRRTRQRNKRLVYEAWIRQLKRLAQQPWKVTIENKLFDSLKIQEHTMSTMMLLGMTFVDPIATIAGKQFELTELNDYES
jgi:hypothetical protein